MTSTLKRARSARRAPPKSSSGSEPPRELWLAYHKRPTVETRNLIIEAYLPLLRTIAAGIKKRLPAQVELEELISAGCFGLIQAIQKYNPSRGVAFSTFCSHRVRGSIIDGLRQIDHSTRQMRERETLVARVCDSFRKQFGRPPGEDEVLARLHPDLKKAERILSDGRPPRTTSLNHHGSSGDHPIRVEDTLPDKRRPSAPARATLRDLQDFALRSLSRTERLVLILYHSEGLTMRETGIALGISESRVSQIRGIVIAKLRDRAFREGEPGSPDGPPTAAPRRA